MSSNHGKSFDSDRNKRAWDRSCAGAWRTWSSSNLCVQRESRTDQYLWMIKPAINKFCSAQRCKVSHSLWQLLEDSDMAEQTTSFISKSYLLRLLPNTNRSSSSPVLCWLLQWKKQDIRVVLDLKIIIKKKCRSTLSKILLGYGNQPLFYRNDCNLLPS